MRIYSMRVASKNTWSEAKFWVEMCAVIFWLPGFAIPRGTHIARKQLSRYIPTCDWYRPNVSACSSLVISRLRSVLRQIEQHTHAHQEAVDINDHVHSNNVGDKSIRRIYETAAHLFDLYEDDM